MHPRIRVFGLPEGMPASIDRRLLQAGDAFSFITAVGNLDVRIDVDGIGGFDAVLARSGTLFFDARGIRMLSLDGIIRSKKFIGRPCDLRIVPELEMMLAAQRVDGDVEGSS